MANTGVNNKQSPFPSDKLAPFGKTGLFWWNLALYESIHDIGILTR